MFNSSHSRDNASPFIGSILIALFIFISFFGLLTFHGMRADACADLYEQFKNSNDSEVQKALPRFSWGSESSLDFRQGMLSGFIIGVPLAILSLIIVKVGYVEQPKNEERETRRATLIGATVFLIYLLFYLLASVCVNPLFLRSGVETSLAFCFGSISCLATYIYIYGGSRKYHRMKNYLKKELQLKLFDLEHTGLRQILHLATWTFFALIISVFFVSFYEYFMAVPAIMSYTVAFTYAMIPIFAWAIMLIIGYFLGIISLIMGIMYDVLGAIKAYNKHLQEEDRNLIPSSSARELTED